MYDKRNPNQGAGFGFVIIGLFAALLLSSWVACFLLGLFFKLINFEKTSEFFLTLAEGISEITKDAMSGGRR